MHEYCKVSLHYHPMKIIDIYAAHLLQSLCKKKIIFKNFNLFLLQFKITII